MDSNDYTGSSVDDLLKEEGVLEVFQAQAIKEVIAWQLDQAMRDQKMTRKAMAKLMRTSPAQLRRVLDPNNSNVTIETLQRAAAVVGRKLQLELV